MGSCYNKIEIDSPINTVWNTISDFHDMSWAPEVITKLVRKVAKMAMRLVQKEFLTMHFTKH